MGYTAWCAIISAAFRRAATCFNDLSIAPVSKEEVRRIQITHPYHPLSGKRFELIEHRCLFTESYVYFHDDDGHLREIPSAWTDFVKRDAFVEIAGDRSPLHAGRLRELADLVARMGNEAGHGG
jgi:hypothetical protein